MDETRIESLTAIHEKASFNCGKPPLNSFIRQHATINNERGVCRVYVAERIGVFAVDLFAKDDDAKSFYLKYGFIPLRDDAFHLYLPIATVRAMFLPAASPSDAPK